VEIPPEGIGLYLDDRPAGAFLTQARTALESCGDPGKLYRRVKTVGLDEKARAELHLRAEGRQINFARTSILFSALAAEAYINAALADKLDDSDFEGIDRLRTVDKYIFGSSIAFGRSLFERSREPAQSIGELFKLRNRLVHAKPRTLRVDRTTLADPRYKDFNPPSAARHLTAVAEAAGILAEAGDKYPDAIVTTIRENAKQFREFGESLREALPPPEERQKTVVRPKKPPPGPVPSTVPRSPVEMLSYLSGLAGTAIEPVPPPTTRDTRGAAEHPD
jgi:hypothetical protein